MSAATRALGLLAAVIAGIWLAAALALALLLHGHRVERAARYADADAARSYAQQGSPEFVALHGRVSDSDVLQLRRGHDSEATWFVPLRAAQAASTGQVHWVVRFEGTSLPGADESILGRYAGAALPRVVRDEWERMAIPLADDAVVVDWVPSRRRVVIDRDADTIAFGSAVAGLVSVICVLGFAMLAALNARASSGSSGSSG